ncbi:mercury resistance system transport protein MerF [Allopontixanthobacter sp.]|uniref:mercury resistance system transport protein MerF n=1 Tax=Allopontixanthobacter sp. TaxID=2906452 RepID=UPI002AB868C0|nr:mercury resistance system transport protein MerF [Allopontixanthobacter sp.]MDZ4308095.1 mercury resistance system transport protein MerF [Allopontixanthobacter sp.]
MNNKTLLGAGLIGTVIASLCCFTPVLIVLAGLIGLAALVGYLDFVLLLALALFVALTVYVMWRRQARFKRSAGVVRRMTSCTMIEQPCLTNWNHTWPMDLTTT